MLSWMMWIRVIELATLVMAADPACLETRKTSPPTRFRLCGDSLVATRGNCEISLQLTTSPSGEHPIFDPDSLPSIPDDACQWTEKSLDRGMEVRVDTPSGPDNIVRVSCLKGPMVVGTVSFPKSYVMAPKSTTKSKAVIGAINSGIWNVKGLSLCRPLDRFRGDVEASLYPEIYVGHDEDRTRFYELNRKTKQVSFWMLSSRYLTSAGKEAAEKRCIVKLLNVPWTIDLSLFPISEYIQVTQMRNLGLSSWCKDFVINLPRAVYHLPPISPVIQPSELRCVNAEKKTDVLASVKQPHMNLDSSTASDMCEKLVNLRLAFGQVSRDYQRLPLG
jgi:hypothetical protein